MNQETSNVKSGAAVACSAWLDRWRELNSEIHKWKDAEYPIGSVVYVNCGQYVGHGIATADRDCPTDRLPVRLENGNIWWYPLDACKRIADLASLPRWVRRMKLQWHGYKCAV